MIGETILHYKIIEKLGEGGMGEVYKAQDTKLDRFVALKFLPYQLTASEDDKARFIQEAKAASAMNHPNVCTIYSIEEYNNQLFIAMEFVEGKTLKDKKDSLSEKQILEIGIQVAEGMAAAHEKGIVHRDIKPENIMIRKDGIVQIMDFGLAKLRETSGVSRLTKAGTTMGTMGYMSPEQVQGLDVDHRTDIFSLGVVLYELVAGESPFKGVHETAIMYEVVNVDPPPISTVKEGIDSELDNIILECLEKDKDERCQSAKELAKDLRKVKKSTGSRATRTYRAQAYTPEIETIKVKSGVFDVNFKRRLIKNKVSLSIYSILIIALLITTYFLLNSSLVVSSKPMHLSITIPGGIALGSFSSFTISPDGSKIVYAVNQANARMLYIRDIDSYDAKPIPGTESGFSPFFSPDGKWLVFITDNGIKKVLISGGAAITISGKAPDLLYAYWGGDNYIYYTPEISGGIYRFSADGGKEDPVALPDVKSSDLSYRWPVLLPGNKSVMFTSESKNESGGSKILIKSLKTNETKTLVDDGSYAQYVNTGYIAYIKDNSLFVAKLNTDNLSLEGSPIPIIQNVTTIPQTGQAEFGMSNNGTLVYLPGGAMSSERNLIWVDRKGNILKSTDLKEPIEDLSLAPDDKKIAVTIEGAIYSIWIYDIERNMLSRFTYSADDRDPLWTPDSKSIIYGSFRNGYYGLFISSVESKGQELRLTKSKRWQLACSVTKDGKYLAYVETDSISRSNGRIAVMELKEGAKPEYIVRTQYNEWFPAFSPNDKYIAYVSDESGRNEIYVIPFNGMGSKIQVSINGGSRPTWALDGKTLYYINDKKLMMASVNINSQFTAGTPSEVFSAGDFYIETGHYYDEIPGTNNFIMIKEKESKVSQNSLNIIPNWNYELKNKLANAN